MGKSKIQIQYDAWKENQKNEIPEKEIQKPKKPFIESILGEPWDTNSPGIGEEYNSLAPLFCVMSVFGFMFLIFLPLIFSEIREEMSETFRLVYAVFAIAVSAFLCLFGAYKSDSM